ncbi:aspartate aminotransferase [Heyndrickxia ginsengihumi]|uniref:Aminotransferase n=1 Tax=Heyndrickxia ginsengihumi TaxID=363870 RepID=A0A0A6Y1S9_9BACI|nr:pyridoxal phosphate-dependent aminotransferase [Heyndrickxia ginsengihumi]KHD86232.1 aspartate aminotransferase [Heyndrickxia ginsengihumi]MBE6184384.1 pyridoxal phosphate-dependent aminotransferase [Bacillus sp. (in: firmicutes)]MCM3024442.1 pyridoxal phosphate-dependent aminotransferase [Heyndrickxia ginsengihumi]
MIAEEYKQMLGKKSVIREIAEYGAERAKEIGYEHVFDYSLGNPSVPVPQAFTDKLIELASSSDPGAVHGYSPSLGIDSVREKVAQSLKRRFGMDYQKEHIFMVSGAAGGLAHALRAVTVKGDEVITFAPYFPEYDPYVNKTGAVLKVVPANTADFQINFTEFEKMLTPNVTAVIINSPNNPSGIVYSTDTLKQLAQLLQDKEKEYGHEIYLISDEPYREIVFKNVDAPYIATFYQNTITCYSFSKSLSIPGERIGYIAVNPACKDAALIVNICGQISRGIGHNCPPSIIQLAIAEVIDMTADLSVYETNMNILYNELTNLGFSCVKPGGTFYMFPKALEDDAVAFCKRALKYNLLLVPADSFGCPGYFRIAYCIPTEKVERSLNAFRKLAEEYKK